MKLLRTVSFKLLSPPCWSRSRQSADVRMQIRATAGLGSGHDCTLRETDPKGVASAVHFGPRTRFRQSSPAA